MHCQRRGRQPKTGIGGVKEDFMTCNMNTREVVDLARNTMRSSGGPNIFMRVVEMENGELSAHKITDMLRHIRPSVSQSVRHTPVLCQNDGCGL